MVLDGITTAFIGFVESLNIWVWLAIVLVLLVWYWWKRPGPRYPPGPRGIPLIGTLPFLGKYPFRTFLKWSKKYGPVFSVRFGRKPVVTLNDYDSIMQAFVNQEKDFTNHPFVYLLNTVRGHHGLGMKNYGDDYKVQKRFMVGEMKRFGLGDRGESIVTQELKYFHAEMNKRIGKPFKLEHHLISAIVNVFMAVCFGKRSDYEDVEFLELVDTLERGSDPPNPQAQIIAFMLPFLRFFPPIKGAANNFMNIEETRKALITNILERQKKSFDESNIRGCADSFYKEMRNGTETFSEDKQVLGIHLEVFAPSLNVVIQMLWILAILLTHPNHYEQIKKEIDLIKDSEIKLKHQQETPLTRAFIQEVVRMSSLVPLGLTRVTSNDVELCGYRIPKGTEIISNLWGANNDPDVWKNPEVFDPLRFIDEDGKFVYSKKVGIIYTLGIRRCLGEDITDNFVYLMLCNLVREFDMSIVAEELPTFENGNVSGFSAPLKYEVIMKRR